MHMTNSERVQPPHVTEEDLLLTPKEAARLLGMSVSWLAKARARGDGPRWVRYGRSVRYPRSLLLEDIRARSTTTDRSRDVMQRAARPLNLQFTLRDADDTYIAANNPNRMEALTKAKRPWPLTVAELSCRKKG
jgi:predicted DNA-binding transcriptional regulator AlpA